MPIPCDRVAVHYGAGYHEKTTVMCYRADVVYVLRHVDDVQLTPPPDAGGDHWLVRATIGGISVNVATFDLSICTATPHN